MRARRPTKKKHFSGFGWDSLLRLLSALMLLALPFVMSPGGINQFREPKAIFADLGILALCAVFLVSRRWSLRFRPLSWEFLMGLAVVYLGLHSLFSRHSELSWNAFTTLCYFIALWLVLREILTPAFLKKLWLWLAGASAVNAALTVLQYMDLIPLLTREGQVLGGRLNSAGFIGDVSTGATIFGIVSILLLRWVVLEEDVRLRVTASAFLALNLAGLIFTRSITPLVALTVAAAAWLVFHHWWHFRYYKRITRPLKVLWVALALALVVGFFGARSAGLTDRLQEVISQMREGDWSVATSGRQPLYRLTWEMIKEKPIAGTGLNSFPVDFFPFRTETDIGQSQRLIDQPGAYREVHNEFLQVWLETGVLGVLLLVALFAIPMARAIGRIRSRDDAQESYWTFLMVAGLIFVAVESLAFFPLQLAVTAAPIVLLLAGLDPAGGEQRLPVETSPGWPKLALKGGAVLLAASWLAYPLAQRWTANKEIAYAEAFVKRSLAETRNARVRAVAAQEALRNLRRAEERCVSCSRLYELKGTALLLLGRYRQAIEPYEVAAYLRPNAGVYTNLSIVLAETGDLVAAREAVERALRYRPGHAQARRLLKEFKSAPGRKRKS